MVGKIKINNVEWYIPHYTPSIRQQAILSQQSLSKTPTELQYVERSVFIKDIKEVNTPTLRIFDLGTQEGSNIFIGNIVGVQQKDRQDPQIFKNDVSYRPPVTSAHCFFVPEKYPDSAISLNYDDDVYSQAYGQFKEALRALTKDDILKPYISDNDFTSSKEGIIFGYNL